VLRSRAEVRAMQGRAAGSVAAMSAPVAAHPASLDDPSQRLRRGMLVIAALLYASGTFGSNIAFAWMKSRPEVVLALSARNRNLLGSVPFVNPVAYSLIGFSRVVLVAVVLYLVGRWYGPKALGWVENQIGELPAVYRWAQTGLDRAGWLLVLLMPGSNLVCLLAGHRRMSLRRFVPMLVLGTILKLVALWIGGRIFDHQIRAFFRFIDGYQWWLVAAAFAITIVQGVRRAQKSPVTVAEVVADEAEPVSPDGDDGAAPGAATTGGSEVSPTATAT
jgi:membrane protein DedA with SNARE-associated domain